MKEALYYKREKDKVRCLLCPNYCLISGDKRGSCGVRINKEGKLYSEIYNRVTSVALDPIEKKPLYHYHRGEYVLSLGTKGCSFACPWCQNWRISQDINTPAEGITKEEAVGKAKKHNSFGIAYTYNEPFIWYEFVLECCKLAREAGLENVFVTNGYINKEPFEKILPYIDAMNIDIKSIDEYFYKKYCMGKLPPILENVKTAKEKGVHIELTNLIIPTLNDSRQSIEKLTDWVAENAGPETPLHFSRYFPRYKTSLPATPVSTLEAAKKIGGKKLKYVYIGNV
ncbi:MAG: AmmeMemoRadiSam system radical SAM enzyme [Candidatus Omnitrophota bacterium]|nr:AmmeMemoRadiSam system radical SAM enzyme [Candidatus Omnitrophota bacterium]